MPVAWYICQYRRLDPPYAPGLGRDCEMNAYTPQIYSQGGQWAETEVLGGYAIVKVRAPEAVLNALDGLFRRLPKDRLDDSLADLPAAVLKTLRDWLLEMGYPLQEIKDRFGNDLSLYTLRDVLRFAARRRLKPRYDPETDEIILDGPVQPVRSIESVDKEVFNTDEEAQEARRKREERLLRSIGVPESAMDWLMTED